MTSLLTQLGKRVWLQYHNYYCDSSPSKYIHCSPILRPNYSLPPNSQFHYRYYYIQQPKLHGLTWLLNNRDYNKPLLCKINVRILINLIIVIIQGNMMMI